MKNLKKALAVVLAMSVVATSASALAAVEGSCTITGEDSTFTTNYDVSNKTLTATANGAAAGKEMSFLILDKGTDVTGIEADDILYIDQKEATAGDRSFTGAINLSRVAGATSEMPAGTYPVRFGYYNSNGTFRLGSGNLVISEVVPAAVQSVTTDATGNATAGTALTITATVNAVGGASTAYTWSVTSKPDGSTATISGNSFTADKVGTYVVKATSTFDSTKTATKTITVVDSSPTLTSASIAGASSAYTDETVTLTGSFVNGDKPNVTLTWSVSGGATLSTTTGATTVVTPSGVGEVTVTLTATSATGVTVTDTHTIDFSVRPAGTKITFRWGDVDADGGIGSTDILAVLNYMASRALAYPLVSNANFDAGEFTVGQSLGNVRWGDVDADGGIGSTDILAVLNYMASRSLAYPLVGNASFTAGQFTPGETVSVDAD